MTNRRRSSLWSAQTSVIDPITLDPMAQLKRSSQRIDKLRACPPPYGMSLKRESSIYLLCFWLWNRTSRGSIVVVGVVVIEVWPHCRHSIALVRCHTQPTLWSLLSEHGFALFSYDILTFLHRNNSPPEISLWKCDPHAGWESHFSKQSKKVKHAWAAQMPKDAKSFGNFQETSFSSILAAEVLKKSKLALPRSTGIKKNNASHRAWGSHFWFLQHP